MKINTALNKMPFLSGERKNVSLKTDESSPEKTDSVHISSDRGEYTEVILVPIEDKTGEGSNNIPEKKAVREKVPLRIALDIGGEALNKTIMGQLNDKELTLNLKHSDDVHGNMKHVASLIQPDEFWVDAGDIWEGYNFHSVNSGAKEAVDLMNLKDCDIAVPGNHFYDNKGKEVGDMILQRAEHPYIAANVKGMSPYVMAEVGGVKMAFIGVRTPIKKYHTIDSSLVKDVEITDPLEAVRKSIEEVKAKGAKNIIVLSHLGLEPNKVHPNIISDKDLARQVPGIDLIIGGHTHTPTFEEVVVNGTRIVHAGLDSHADVHTDNLYLGDLSLKFDRSSGKLTSISHKLIPVDRKMELDKEVKEISDKYIEEDNKALSEKLGKSLGEFRHEIKTKEDSSLGNFITDVMREKSGADIALLNSNFFAHLKKAPPPKVIPEGEITMKELTGASIWISAVDIRTETWDVKGSKIKEALEDGVNKLLGPKEADGLMQISGMEMTYSPGKPEGERATVTVGGKPLDLNRTYKLVTTNYVGEWEPVFSDRDENSVIDGRELRQILADYIKEKGTISPVKDGRIKVLSDQ